MLCVELSSNRLNREAVVLYSMSAVEIQFSLSWTNWSLYSQMYIVHTHATQMPGTSNFICVQYTRIFMMHTRPIDRGWRCSEGQTKRANKRERKKKNSKKQKRIYRWSSSWVMRMCVSVLLYHWLLYHLLHCWFHLQHTRTRVHIHSKSGTSKCWSHSFPRCQPQTHHHRLSLSSSIYTALIEYIHCHFLLFNKHIHRDMYNIVVYHAISHCFANSMHFFHSLLSISVCVLLLRFAVFHLFKNEK